MSTLQSQLAEALGNTYRIERELGGGGMSHVFLAEEVALGRKVVIKVLPPETSAGVNEDRFRREIQLAARLQHPNIVPLLTAGAAGTLLYYVMPFIEGESLRARLAREGELPVTEAVRILREVTDALAGAHEQGVVHRDIKPDNVLLSRGHALVTDFGVAKAVSESASGGGQSLTSLGVALGTPAYMAPEQATADPHVDHRADVYSLGALAYEMLAGRPPFAGSSPQATLMAHVTQAPERLSVHRPAVPVPLEQVVMRCLEKRPADRWQGASELLPVFDALLTPSGGTQPLAAASPPTTSSGVEAALRRAQPVRVAALFALGAVVVLSTVGLLTRQLGLPAWVTPAAGVLLLVGFPIVLMAAARERAMLIAQHTGQHSTTPTGLAGRLLSVRGALTGGGLAFGGLAVGTALFMGLRILGIGPFATLVSAGVLSDRDKLILADFANRTPDSTLGASITAALRIDLARSPVVRLAEVNEVSATLRRMQRDPEAEVGEAIAREVALRTGAAAVVAGEIAPLGAGFVLTARLISATDSSTLVAERETASDAAGLISAVEALSKKLRERIGESLRSINGGQPLEEVTTTSLAALRAYSEGVRLLAENRGREAYQAMERAVSLDSTFGMAWRLMGVLLWNASVPGARMVQAVTRAYELRDRMPPLEAAHAAAFYYSAVERDRPKTIRSYEQLLATWPNDLIAMNNLAVQYGADERYADAESLYRRATALRPDAALYLGNLTETLVNQGELAEADSVLSVWGARAPTNASRFRFAARVSRERGNLSRALLLADSSKAAEGSDALRAGTMLRAELLRFQGRFRDAERETRTAIAIAEKAGDTRDVLAKTSTLAFVDAFVFGRHDAAAQAVERALARTPRPEPGAIPHGDLAVTFIAARQLGRARELLAEFERTTPADVRDRDGLWNFARGMLALEDKDPRGAFDLFRRAREIFRCHACTAFEEGQAYEQLAVPDSAIAAYERFATLPRVDSDTRDLLLAAALRRLGELYESKGDRQKAAEAYGRFVDLWKDADPELQGLVRDLRRRITELAGEPPR